MLALSSMSLGQLMLYYWDCCAKMKPAGDRLGEEGDNQDGDTRVVRVVRELRKARKWVSQEVSELKVKADDRFDIYCNRRRNLPGIFPGPGKGGWREDSHSFNKTYKK